MILRACRGDAQTPLVIPVACFAAAGVGDNVAVMHTVSETHWHWFAHALLPTGWAEGVRLGASDGRIACIAADAAPQPEDHREAVVLPGLPNLHSHAFQRAMAGLTEVRGNGPDSFWTWRRLMYRFVDQLSPDDLEAIAAQAYVEMMERGFTRVGEFHYLHHDPAGRPYADPGEMSARIVAAAATSGIGLTLLPVYYAQGGFGGVPAADAQRRFLNDPERYAVLLDAAQRALAALPDAVLGVAPHSLRAVTAADLDVVVRVRPGGPVHIHIAEQTAEVEQCLQATGQRPVEWLLGHQAVDARWCLVHATHMSATEIAGLAASGAVAGLCPITEANLGDGLFAAVDYGSAGGAWGLGSDSNVRIDAAEELRTLEYGQRAQLQARNVLAPATGGSSGRALFDGALRGGARALGVAAGLRVGAAADFFSLDVTRPEFVARRGDAWLDSWVFAGGNAPIDKVWRAGRKWVDQGRHIHSERIGAAYRRALQRLLA